MTTPNYESMDVPVQGSEIDNAGGVRRRGLVARLMQYRDLTLEVARRKPLGIAVIVILTAGLLASDWARHRLLNDFWTGHPVLASEAAALYFAALAAVILRTWAEARDLRRHQRVRHTGYVSLIQHMNQWRDMLIMAVAGKFPVDPPPRYGPDALSHISSALARAGVTSVDPLAEFDPGRLDLLLQHSVWVSEAYRIIADVKLRAREALAPWLPLVLSSAAIADDISHVVVLIAAFEDLQHPLQHVHRVQGSLAGASRPAVIDLWAQLLVTIVVVEEFLVARFRRVDWTSAARVAIPRDQRSRLSAYRPRDPHTLEPFEEDLENKGAAVRNQLEQSYEIFNRRHNQSQEPSATGDGL